MGYLTKKRRSKKPRTKKSRVKKPRVNKSRVKKQPTKRRAKKRRTNKTKKMRGGVRWEEAYKDEKNKYRELFSNEEEAKEAYELDNDGMKWKPDHLKNRLYRAQLENTKIEMNGEAIQHSR